MPAFPGETYRALDRVVTVLRSAEAQSVAGTECRRPDVMKCGGTIKACVAQQKTVPTGH